MMPARMRVEDGWHDVVIRNVSRRGMLLQATPSPPTGSYVEIRLARINSVARIVWSRGHLAGARLQDPLQLEAIFGMAKASYPSEPANDAVALRPRASPSGLAARSREFAYRFQYMVLMLAVVLVGAALAKGVVATLGNPFAAVRSQLGGH